MPIQGSLRDLSVIETLQLVGSQRKTVSLRFATEEEEVVLHVREGLLTSIRATRADHREPFIDALGRGPCRTPATRNCCARRVEALSGQEVGTAGRLTEQAPVAKPATRAGPAVQP